MKYTMTTPCDACPFTVGSGFTWHSLAAHARGEFACHKTCNLVETEDEGDVYQEKPGNKSLHCAGALIFLEQQDAPHQMMRICERLGMYDHTKLDKTTRPVVRSPRDCRKPTKREQKSAR